MASAYNVINSRLANALQGGLWVGGKAVLSSGRLTFSANAMNKALHSEPSQLNWSIPLAEIVAVHVRRGVLTDIIDVQTHARTRSVRCFRAKAFADKIERASVAQRQEASGSA